MKALAPLTLDLQPRPVHRSVPVMHANGSGGVAPTVTPRFVFLLWELETNYGILHVHRNVNYTEMKMAESLRCFLRETDSSHGLKTPLPPVLERTAQIPTPTNRNIQGRPRGAEQRPPAAPIINCVSSGVGFTFFTPTREDKHRDRPDLSVNIRQEIRAPAGLKVSLTENQDRFSTFHKRVRLKTDIPLVAFCFKRLGTLTGLVVSQFSNNY